MEVSAWSAGVLESLILLLVERNKTLGFCFLSYTGFKSTQCDLVMVKMDSVGSLLSKSN